MPESDFAYYFCKKTVKAKISENEKTKEQANNKRQIKTYKSPG